MHGSGSQTYWQTKTKRRVGLAEKGGKRNKRNRDREQQHGDRETEDCNL